MSTHVIDLPFELSYNNIPLHVKEEYCCNVELPDAAGKRHFHMYITYLEICDEYKIMQFDKDKSDYTNPDDPYKYFNWFQDQMYPIVVMLDTAGGVIEVCNREEILNNIESLFKKLYSPYISEAFKKELQEHYEHFHNIDTIQNIVKQPFFQLVFFPIYTQYTKEAVCFQNSYEKEGETHTLTYAAKIEENLNEFGHIQISFTGIYNMNSNFLLDTIYTFDPNTHTLQSIKGENTLNDSENIVFEFSRIIKD
jgi:hypothetical protein